KVGPRIDRGGCCPAKTRRQNRIDQFVFTAPRIVVFRAYRGPFGYLEKMLRETPGGDRLEHAVMQHEIARIGPIVRDIFAVVIAHGRTRFRLDDKTVHPSAIDISYSINGAMWVITISVVSIMIGLGAVAVYWIRHADIKLAALPRNAINSRERTEITIERAILLHDDYHVLDLVNARQAALMCFVVFVPAIRMI